MAQESTEPGDGHAVTCQSKFRPSHPLAVLSFIHLALPVLSCPTVDADAVLLFADRGRVYVTVWKPGLEVLRVSRCVLDYVTMDNAGGPHTCTAELKYAILRAG